MNTDETMHRLLIFFLVAMALGVYLRYFARGAAHAKPLGLKIKKKIRPIKAKAIGIDELWGQVYDTESIDDARKVQQSFMDLGIQCFVYTQGKKDVYGELLKHFGVSVPQKSLGKAQAILSEIVF
ncbi:MAG: hypothetical protein ACI9CF_000203 [Candidatus Omnitrophota bacterium]|jgi:hypothetical protein